MLQQIQAQEEKEKRFGSKNMVPNSMLASTTDHINQK